ncbi:hypothetical protein [Phnomibacter ginsenosidimutans]|uniref:Lipoprotein n=1 Tax=Phnomibacter ginsenosidimutans TaxID=2676868 RepID=A0A6I6G5V1_9BACT|nr:hypothetical protein [Phnomibacter ginsenosidimutans]QGW28056.1 hypothetical protein GLV81_08050 [Phnomibacter ginsenosidimutans]
MSHQRLSLLSVGALFVAAILLYACGKDKYTSKPQLKFIKADSYDVARGGFITLRLEFSDKEGDLTDSLFIRSEAKGCPTSNISVGYPIPTFPTTTNSKGELEVTFANSVNISGYLIFSPKCNRPDTTTFYFWIKDKAKNVSDTISTDKPLIIRN